MIVSKKKRVKEITGMDELCDVRIWREEEDDVVQWDGADEVQEEPRLQVMFGDLPRLQDYVVCKVVRYDA